MQPSPVLAAGAVTMRRHVPEDREAIIEACRDEETWRWTTVPHPYEPAHADAYLARTIGSEVDQEWPRWAIEVAGRFAGNLGCSVDSGLAKVGYWVSPWARGRGVATLALWLACDWAFRDGGCTVVGWEALIGNDGSRRVAEKVGFQIKAEPLRRYVAQRGERVDVWYGDLQPEDLVALETLLP